MAELRHKQDELSVTHANDSSNHTHDAEDVTPVPGADRGTDTKVQTFDDVAAQATAARAAEAHRHRAHGGFNLGAAFFGWLVAVALTLLLVGIVGAIAAGIGETLDVTQSEAEREAGTIGTASAIAMLLILMLGYYAGGYVAGRMSRYDGGRQGLGVWVIGLVVTLVVVALGWIFGREYDVFQRVDLPSIPIPTDALSAGGLITLAAVVAGTFLAAMVGGKAGQHYHRKIDRTF